MPMPTKYIYYSQFSLVIPDLKNIKDENISTSILLTNELFADYLDDIFSYTTYFCKPKKTSFLLDYFIKLNFNTLTCSIPLNLRFSINECLLKGFIFFIIPINLQFSDSEGHSNFIIYNNLTGIIKHFEPHGRKMDSFYDIQYHIKNSISTLFNKPIESLFMENMQTECMGFQSLQNTEDPNAGHCLAWSLLFIQLHFLNQTLTSDIIIRVFKNNFTPKALDKYIKKYLTYIEQRGQINIKLYSRQSVDYDIILKHSEKNFISTFVQKSLDDILENIIEEDEEENNSVSEDSISDISNISEDTRIDVSEKLDEILIYTKIPEFSKIFIEYTKWHINHAIDTRIEKKLDEVIEEFDIKLKIQKEYFEELLDEQDELINIQKRKYEKCKEQLENEKIFNQQLRF